MATLLYVLFTLLLAAQSNALALRVPTATATRVDRFYHVGEQPLPTLAPVDQDLRLLRRDLTITTQGYLIAPDGIFGYYAGPTGCMFDFPSKPG